MSMERSRNNRGEVCPDHIHVLVSIPPKMSVSGFMEWGAEVYGCESGRQQASIVFDVAVDMVTSVRH